MSSPIWVYFYQCIITPYMKRVGETDKVRGYAEHLTAFSLTSLINAIVQE